MSFSLGTSFGGGFGSLPKYGSLNLVSPMGTPQMMNRHLAAMEMRESSGYRPSTSPLPAPGVDASIVKRRSKMDALHQATAAGQLLRLRLLAGSVIVFVNAGYKGKRFIYERARDLGVVVVVIDSAGAWCVPPQTHAHGAPSHSQGAVAGLQPMCRGAPYRAIPTRTVWRYPPTPPTNRTILPEERVCGAARPSNALIDTDVVV
jgi:hypothetical protein